MRTLIKVVLVVAVLYALLVAATLAAMYQPPERFGRIMSHVPDVVAFMILPFKPLWLHARAGRLAVGDPAPNFSLTTEDKKQDVTLASFQGQKPVVLVFGSYT
ncbi:MAG TPA: hypothetical protein VGW33_03305 [Terriglobia bacterium]|nr:hypothetical protein [Terriglobia bacterium]